jgi:hypothetical protein
LSIKAFTIQALSELIKIPVTQDNFRLVQSYVELVDLPMRGSICEELERRFGEAPQMPFADVISDEA